MKNPIVPTLAVTALAAISASPLQASEPGNLFPEGSFDQPLEIVAKSPNPATEDPLNAQEGVLYVEPGNYKDKGCIVEFTSDGGQQVLRFVAPENFEGILRTYIPLRLPEPTPASLTLAIRWRVQNYQVQNNAPGWASAQCDPIFVLSNGEKTVINNTLRITSDTGPDFVEMEKTVSVPEGAQMLILQPGLYCISGTLDIDEIKVFAE